MVILELIRAKTPDFLEGWHLLEQEPSGLPLLVNNNNWADRVYGSSFKFLTYQLPTVGYWPTVALTGNGELGFDSGEGAWETATTSKEGSRRANYPILTQGGSDKKYQRIAFALRLKWVKFKTFCEYQLEGKSGASSRGNSSSNSVY
jgi:hypothetical protein